MIGNETFRGNPVSLDISRSAIHVAPTTSGTFNAGELVPFYQDSLIMPGTTIKLDLRSLVRMSTPVGVPMDNLYLDVYFFFVPHKLTLSRANMTPSVQESNRSFAAFMGAQDNLLNMPTPSDIKLPAMLLNNKTAAVGGVWDWTGCQNKLNYAVEEPVNPLNFLAYCKIWNDYFRDPNGSMNPVTFTTSTYDSGVSTSIILPSSGPSSWSYYLNTPYINQFPCLPVCRFHGYYGSVLPWPQRNSTMVSIPVGDSAPLISGSSYNIKSGALLFKGKTAASGSVNTEIWSDSSQTPTTTLYADLTQAAGVTVNQFRQLVQEQRWYEALARSGNNTLAELTSGMFNVTPSDAISNRAELLGSKRIPLNIIQVNNTAGSSVSTDIQSSLGSTGSFSLTNDSSFMFSKSFDTWGSLIGVACVRCDDTFSQGLDRQYSKFDRFDYYWPQFANLGEQAVLNKEIYCSGQTSDDNAVFGYQEAWAEYRFRPNHVCGLLRPSESLGYWTFANHFSSLPSLNSFIDASSQKSNIDQALQVSHDSSGFQFMGQFCCDMTIVYPMPTYSIPGLVDHH